MTAEWMAYFFFLWVPVVLVCILFVFRQLHKLKHSVDLNGHRLSLVYNTLCQTYGVVNVIRNLNTVQDTESELESTTSAEFYTLSSPV